jgi:hypothetical protein
MTLVITHNNDLMLNVVGAFLTAVNYNFNIFITLTKSYYTMLRLTGHNLGRVFYS